MPTGMPTTLISSTSTITSDRPKPASRSDAWVHARADRIDARRIGIAVAEQVVVGGHHRVDGDEGEQVGDAPGQQREDQAGLAGVGRELR